MIINEKTTVSIGCIIMILGIIFQIFQGEHTNKFDLKEYDILKQEIFEIKTDIRDLRKTIMTNCRR